MLSEPISVHIDESGHSCRVCRTAPLRPFARITGWHYYRCDRCLATFLDSAHWLTADQEYAHYLNHNNSITDTAYRRFLAKLAEPLLSRLAAGSDGLDYGCGPGPALAQMLSEAGHRLHIYDPFFAPDQAVLAQSYDFITCTEVIEHFQQPAQEFARLAQMLRPGGWLAIMTCWQQDDAHFASWYYRLDPTHVVFYQEATLRYLAQVFGWTCEFLTKDVVLLQKPLS